MELKLELVPVPVADVDRARDFYAGQLGFVIDFDHRITDDLRLVQLTPPGSACSIMLGAGTDAAPGSLKGLQLVVDDIAAVRAELAARGTVLSAIQHFEDGSFVDGPGEPWNSFVFFSDPDGNSWVIQERPH
jgi:catechol 2,3-dioxygenase-like lactoylglutathione lyase family enzyme